MRSSRIAGHVAALALLGAVACSSSSSSIPKGNLELEGGPADATSDVTPGAAAGPVDGSTDSSGPGQDAPSDAAPVDAAFACAHASNIADCGYCATEVACIDCATTVSPQGAPAFKALIQCLECTACYTSCGGSDKGCTGAPSMVDPCDRPLPSQAGCQACQACAVAGQSADAAIGTCNPQAMVCQSDHGCEQTLSGVAAACSHLP